jgi:uncharacterized protein
MRLAVHRRLLLLAFLAFAPAAWAEDAGRAEDDIAAGPIRFYRAETAPGRVTFFYPSFHLRDPRVPRPPLAMLDRVHRLVLEADIVDAKAHPEALTPYIVGATPLDLGKLFTPAEIAGIRARAECNGIGAGLETLRLSFIATILALPCPKPDRGSYEEQVELAARDRGLEITGLESAPEEFAALAAMPDRLFIEEIKSLAADEAGEERLIARMIALYNAADLDGLYTLMSRSGLQRAADRKLFLDKVLIERNRRMAERLAGVLARGDALVMIGALHFPGKDGILHLLTLQGVKVTAINVTDGALR